MSDNRPSNDAIVVLLTELREDVKEIKSDVKAQNSRVRKLEDDAIRIKTLWTAGGAGVVLFGDWLKHKLGL